jgi:hypothetical protein
MTGLGIVLLIVFVLAKTMTFNTTITAVCSDKQSIVLTNELFVFFLKVEFFLFRSYVILITFESQYACCIMEKSKENFWSFGKVFLCRHIKTGELKAVKMFLHGNEKVFMFIT